MTANRLIPLDGCFNFRDLGGYAGAGGRPVRWGRLYRADALQRLSDADLGRLAELDIRHVIDLRTPGELDEQGRIIWPGRDLGYRNLPMMDVLPDTKDFNRTWTTSEGVSAQYLSILSRAAPAVTAALSALCDPGTYPAVIHCAAGKDRTGILSAIVLSLLGVADDDIIADYALSAEAMERMVTHLRRTRRERAGELAASTAAMVHASPQTMAAFLAGVRQTHGGVSAYTASLGLPDAEARLRSALLERLP